MALAQQFIDQWRANADIAPARTLRPLAKREGVLNIVALMSCPRLGWTDTWACVNDTFHSLGMGVAKHTGVFWGQGLTKLMEDAIALDMDYVITVDYDSVFNADHVIKLVMLINGAPDVDAVVSVQVRRECNSSMFTLPGLDGHPRKGEANIEEFRQPLTRIATGHFGLSVFRVSSLAKLPRPWFLAIPNANGEWKDGHIDEDVYFWLNAGCSGWNVAMANDVKIGHVQNVVSWPASDFTPRFQYLTDWNAVGQPA
jgi:hypothetical protein